MGFPEQDASALIVGTRIRQARLDAKLTGRALAKKLGVAGDYPGQMERGYARPSIQMLIWLGMALGKRPAWFLEDL